MVGSPSIKCVGLSAFFDVKRNRQTELHKATPETCGSLSAIILSLSSSVRSISRARSETSTCVNQSMTVGMPVSEFTLAGMKLTSSNGRSLDSLDLGLLLSKGETKDARQKTDLPVNFEPQGRRHGAMTG